jgi:DnaJ family protein A protein 2
MQFGGIPFEQFMGGGMGGMPGMGGHPGMQRQSKPVDTSEYYDLLGVSKNATETEIKKAFRKKAMKEHPDRGGDAEKFKKISEAYETLADSDKRQLYDRHGKEGAERAEQAGGDPFASMFGGRGGRQQRGPKKGEDLVHPLKVGLDALYNGKVFKLAINRQVQENKDEKPRQCQQCDGKGAQMKIRQIGPGMMQQCQVVCDRCKGQGYNTKMKKERKVLKVGIEKGMKNGQKIKFQDEGDQKPGGLPGDVIFVVQMKEHKAFTRKGPHLFMNKSISLSEALCGTKFVVEHLDGRKLVISTQPGEVLTSESVKMVEGEGMPHHGNPFLKGNLVVKFNVVFPADGSLDAKALAAIKAALPAAPTVEVPEDAEEYDMQPFDADAAQADYAQNRSAYESDDEESGPRGRGGGQPVQCAQG